MAKRGGQLNYGKSKKDITLYNQDEPYSDSKEEIVEPVNKYEAEYSIIQDKVSQLYFEIDNSLKGGTPFFVFNVKRRNEKIKLNTEAMEMMLSQIRTLRDISAELLNLRADDIYGPEQLKNIIEEKYILAKQYFERIKEEHLTRIKKEQASRANIDYDLTDREISQRKEKAIIERLEYEAKQEKEKYKEMKVKVKEAKIRLEIINIVKGDMKFSDLPKSHQTYILNTILNVDSVNLSNFDIGEMLKASVLKTAAAEADKKEQEVNSLKTRNANDEWKFERDKKSVEKNDKR